MSQKMGLRRIAVGWLASSLTAAAVAAPASAAPDFVGTPLSIPQAALTGWKFYGLEGSVMATAEVPNVAWKSAIDLGKIRGFVSISERAPLADLARNLFSETVSPRSVGYSSRVSEAAVTPITVSGRAAVRASATITVRDQPIKTMRLHIVVVDTTPRTYFRSRVPQIATQHTMQADAAEAGLKVANVGA
ncbi:MULTISPECIES: hypothetical protein [Tsukamurella]|uniref:Lipid/polyisoprenoid-binding YceI-like domain-containing protein n=2 Tax=Tsukamurella TaxID=2060 RepID=A0A5C5S432_9ACTN|nr:MULTISPECIES: hypothetical protein [Tsukamurella]NMD54921.1 hypothetical protein [Tsukamurella columbiensis]TWS29540.1 hypothetical protein FK530_08450 [Tsukamurella conjunctivitidis]